MAVALRSATVFLAAVLVLAAMFYQCTEARTVNQRQQVEGAELVRKKRQLLGGGGSGNILNDFGMFVQNLVGWVV